MMRPENWKEVYRNPAAWIVVIVVAAAALGWPPPQNPRMYPDSVGYVEMSSERMPVYSLLASALGPTYLLVCFQFVLSLAAWTWFGHTIGRVVGVLLGACFALSVPVYVWDLIVLSESLSLSLLAASLATTILMYRRWTRVRFAVWCVIALLFSLTRATNVFLLPFLAVPFLATTKKQLLYVSLSAIVLLAAVDVYGRTVGGSLRTVSMVNVYTGRILPDPERRGYFVERGMPLKDEMEPFIGETGRENAEALFKACPEFARWFKDRGVSTYYRWLFTQPYNYKMAAAAVATNLNFMNLRYTEGTQGRRVPALLIWFYAIPVPRWIWLVGLLPLLSWRLVGRPTPDSLLVTALLAGIYALTWVSYHGDRAELSRHLLVALVLCKVTLFVTIAVVIGMVWQWRRRQPQVAPVGAVPHKKRGTTPTPRGGRGGKGRRKKTRR
jgi:hypothetical protein